MSRWKRSEGEQEDLYMFTGTDMMFCLVMSSINLLCR